MTLTQNAKAGTEMMVPSMKHLPYSKEDFILTLREPDVVVHIQNPSSGEMGGGQSDPWRLMSKIA